MVTMRSFSGVAVGCAGAAGLPPGHAGALVAAAAVGAPVPVGCAAAAGAL